MRMLIVEDSADDAEVALLELSRGGVVPDWRRVETADAMRAALAEGPWDVVLSDFTMPGFGAAQALALCREADPDLPFVVVSGTIGEQRAVEMMRAGAGDYLLKGNLTRLPAAVAREVGEAENRRARRRAEQAASLLAAVVGSSEDAILTETPGGVITSWNPAAERLYGPAAFEAVGRPVSSIVPPDKVQELAGVMGRLRRGERVDPFETVRLHSDGTRIDVALTISPVRDRDGLIVGVSKTARDVTARRRAEADRALLAAVVESSEEAFICADLEGVILSWNPAAERLFGYAAGEAVGRSNFLLVVPPELMEESRDRVQRLLRGERLGPLETVRLRKGGGRVLVAMNVSAVRVDGRVTALVAVYQDVTARREAEAARARADEAVRASEARFRALVEKSYDGVVLLDAAGTVLYASPSAGRIGGRPPEGHVGRKVHEYGHPDEAPSHAAELQELIRHPGGSFTGEGRLLHADGSWRWVESTCTNMLGDPAVGALVVNFRDVTDRKQADAELRRAGALLRAVADGTPDAVFVKDLAGRYLLANPAAAGFMGRPVGDILGKDDTEFFDPEGARQVIENDRRVMESGVAVTWEERLTSGGMTRTYLATKAPHLDANGVVVGVIGVSRDVTDRKRAEDALRDKEAKLAEAVRLARMGYWNRDLVTGDLDWSDELYVLFGVDPAKFGRTIESFLATLHPDDREVVRERIAEAEGSLGSFDHNYRVVVRGEVRVIHEVGHVIVSEDGTPCRVAGTAQDVTERTRAEEALRLRDRAIGAATQGIIITDPSQPDGPIVYASPSFERLTGYTAGEVVGLNCRLLQGKDTDPDAVGRIREAVGGGRPCTVELLNYRKDGSPFWNELSISPVRDDRGQLTHFIGVQTDVTQRRLLEEQYRQSQKMDAFGQLAGGVAHDFNNLLTVISGYSEMMLNGMPANDPKRALLQEIHKAGERATLLTGQLLAFSRKAVVEPKVLVLNAIVTEMDKMLGRLIGEDVVLTAALAPDLGQVRADAGQLAQVILNLAVNARDAMPRGGRLTIETANVRLDEHDAHLKAEVQPGEYVLLAVSDTGCGMAEEVKARIFEPFFTTKEVGKGTGLGLATVFGIVKSSGGHVGVYSEPGRGTTFKVYLPRVGGAVPADRSPGGRKAVPHGGETILLVEDEDAVRALARLALTMYGYNVLEARDGPGAIELAAAYQGLIHLVVTDVVMPGMGGQEVAERLRSSRPGIRVLFQSGYTDDAVVRHGVLHAEVAFLQKPYTPAVIALKVQEVLNQP